MRLGSLIAAGAIAGAAATAYHLTRERPEAPPPTPGVPEAPPPAGSVAPPGPGDEVVLTLIEKPETSYRLGTGDDAYRDIAERVAAGAARYDARLARAARELAYDTALLGRSPPQAALAFLLRSAGAPETSAARFVLHTNSEGDDAIERAVAEALERPPEGAGDLVFGVGEAETPGASHRRRIVVLSARRDFSIRPAPRFARPGAVWTLSGELPESFTEPSAAALYPGGAIRHLPVHVSGRRFELSVPTGKQPGALDVDIDGVGAAGPGKLLQLRVEVGRPLPRRRRFVIPAADPPLSSIAEAEAHALELLADDREAAGAPPLEPDPELSALARRHSEEMRDLGYFGHLSPKTGLVLDRLRSAGIEVAACAENLAKNTTLAEAEASLMTSVGHRANLLSDRFTRVGVGLARDREQGETQWYLTQVFALPAEAKTRSRAP